MINNWILLILLAPNPHVNTILLKYKNKIKLKKKKKKKTKDLHILTSYLYFMSWWLEIWYMIADTQ